MLVIARSQNTFLSQLRFGKALIIARWLNQPRYSSRRCCCLGRGHGWYLVAVRGWDWYGLTAVIVVYCNEAADPHVMYQACFAFQIHSTILQLDAPTLTACENK